jgi:hypothetical protein
MRDAYLVLPLQLAYHEVGHALIGHATGRSILRLSVNRHGGLTSSEGPASPLILLLVSLGGSRAERLCPDGVEELADLDAGSRDQRDVDFALDVIGGDKLHRDFVLADAIREVDALLSAERDQLDKVARRLLRLGRLDGRELARLLEGR